MDLANADDPTSDYDPSIINSNCEFSSIARSSIYYTYEHGRRYQNYVQSRYGLPNDDMEQQREAFKHQLYVDYIHKGKYFVAPIGDYPQKIVDLGTGAGYWPQDVGERYPSAKVIGIDISPIQPRWTAPNVEFRVEDLEDERRNWTSIYKNSDLIHIRGLLQTVRDPNKIIERCFENLKPGGWIEIHELNPILLSEDGTTPIPDHPLTHIYNLIDTHWSQHFGWNIRIPSQIPHLLQQAGFTNIQLRHNNVPLGNWHREEDMRIMGLFSTAIVEDFCATVLTKYGTLGLTEEEAEGLGGELEEAVGDRRRRCMLDWVDFWAQKPSVS